MFHWGELDSLNGNSDGFKEMIRGKTITDVTIREGLATFLMDTDREATALTSLKRIPLSWKKQRIVLLGSGKKHVVVVFDAGMVREWNVSSESCVPRTFGSGNWRRVEQVTCGNYHSIVLTKDGHLFTWGQNSNGQLGLGIHKSSSLNPRVIESLRGIPLVQISAGGDHSFALSLSGAVFSWGRNNAGQLGLGDTDDRHVPVCVKSLNLKKTIRISCGEDHTAVLTKGGQMLTFGSGHYGQLGHNSLRDEHHPRVVAEFWGSKVSQIACGQYHTLALVESSKTIYFFGCGEQGQLGNGLRTNQCVPFPLQLPPEFSCDHQIRKITAGGNLSIAFVSKMDENSNPNPSVGSGPTMLDDKIIGCWISDCSPTEWKKYKGGEMIINQSAFFWKLVDGQHYRSYAQFTNTHTSMWEIKSMFSSVSCINASFTEKSDKHYKTSVGNSGLDLSLARLAFEKLAKKDTVLNEVEKTIRVFLLPSLGSSAAGVEALRVYLILPEFLRVLKKQNPQSPSEIPISLASAILNLKPESMDMLASLWTKLPYYYFRTLVKTFHSVCAHFMSLMTTISCDHWTKLKPVLEVLQKLYNINSQRVTQLTEDYFIIKELGHFFNFVEQYPLQSLLQCPWNSLFITDRTTKAHIFFKFLRKIDLLECYTFILDHKWKRITFQVFTEKRRDSLQKPLYENTLCVNRDTVLADTLKYLKRKPDFEFPLKIKFDLEDGIDDGGVRNEFFTLLGKKMTEEASVIQADEDSGLFWFSGDDSNLSQEELFSIGVICGMAFYNHCFMNIGFPVALFKKLLKLRPTITDMEEMSPVEARSLKELLLEDENVVEELYLDFTVKGEELIPNGAQIPVTKANRQKYVDLYIDFVFNKSVESQFQKFEEGFSRGNPFNLWKMFKPHELQDLLYGTSKYEWTELKKGTTYGNCWPSDELIQNFWYVFFELEEENQKKFLTFMYGTDRVPVGGLSKLTLRIVRCDYLHSDDYFPSAHTCYGILHLPNYSSIHILREKLIHAIKYCEIFGKI